MAISNVSAVIASAALRMQVRWFGNADAATRLLESKPDSAHRLQTAIACVQNDVNRLGSTWWRGSLSSGALEQKVNDLALLKCRLMGVQGTPDALGLNLQRLAVLQSVHNAPRGHDACGAAEAPLQRQLSTARNTANTLRALYDGQGAKAYSLLLAQPPPLPDDDGEEVTRL